MALEITTLLFESEHDAERWINYLHTQFVVVEAVIAPEQEGFWTRVTVKFAIEGGHIVRIISKESEL